MWNIKKIINKGDYLYALVPEHPNATKNGYVLMHRIVMENHLGRLLSANEVVHHIDKNKKNNSVDNLKVLTVEEHNKLHAMECTRAYALLKCPWCGKIFEREYRFVKNHRWSCCSRHCNGCLSREIQLNGVTHKVESAISENLLARFNKRVVEDNSEETDL